jgi:predicted nucleotidyltransferase
MLRPGGDARIVGVQNGFVSAATGTMNSKQKIALCIIAGWADRFTCVKSAVIYGSVARCEEKPSSDLDLDLQFDLTAPGMAASYTNAQQSLNELHEQILSATGHRLKISNYVITNYDHIARRAIECGTEIGVRGKARIVATKPK